MKFISKIILLSVYLFFLGFVANAQTNIIEAQLQAFVDNGAVKNGIVVQMQSTNPQLQYAIKQESTKTPGKFRYFFIDRRVGRFENGTFVFYETWNPGQSDVYEPSTINATESNKTKSNDDLLANAIVAQVMASNVLGNFIKDVANGNYKEPNNISNNSTSNSSNNQVCSYCKPYDTKGIYIHDYSVSNKTFINGRFLLRPGYVRCSSCKGTGNCKAYNSCSSSQENNKNYTCQICNGDRFTLCSKCKGTGKSG